MTFTSPGGEEKTVPRFWDGGRTWKVRFRQDAEGEWTYLSSTANRETGLHGLSGGFTCEAVFDGANRVYTHGPVRLSENGHHCVVDAATGP